MSELGVREKYWEEMSLEQKMEMLAVNIERLHGVVRTLNSDVHELSQYISNHAHVENGLVYVPISSKAYNLPRDTYLPEAKYVLNRDPGTGKGRATLGL